MLPGDGTHLAAALGAKRLLACGVRKPDAGDDRVADLLVRALAPLACKLDFPWLAAASGGDVPSMPAPLMVKHRARAEMQ